MTPSLPLSALLSQVLVAFTVEFDNEFERRMLAAGYQGARFSLVLWSNLLRFVGPDGVLVRELVAQSLIALNGIKLQLGCLERWRVIVMQAGKRAGWGSGRGIRTDWLVRLTPMGQRASEIWPPLFDEIEGRWRTRFGAAEIGRLRESLEAVADQLTLELPHAFPGSSPATEKYPARVSRGVLTLPALLSQVLLAFTLEFDSVSKAPLALCANTIRVLGGEKPVRVADIARLTGASPETSGIGWQIKPYVRVQSDPNRIRGTLVELTPLGLKAFDQYGQLVREIERRWEARFGKQVVQQLCDALQALFEQGGGAVMSKGLVPPPGVVRAGDRVPALGRKSVAPAALQRARDLVAQTEEFVRDPAGALPHHPLWDMNRGFGP